MTTLNNLVIFYRNLILNYSWLVLLFIFCLCIFAAYHALNFQIDASADSLVLENDESLKYYRATRDKYGTDEFLVITYTPHTDLLSEESLDGIRSIRDEILKLDSIQSVTSILDVPIIVNTDYKLSEISSHLETIESQNVDLEVARKEFQINPYYKNLLVSEDGKTTALEVVFKQSNEYYELIKQRTKLREKALTEDLNAEEDSELNNIIQEIKAYNSNILAERRNDIEAIRAIMDKERSRAKLFLGGIPMITVDMINYIRHDLIVFGFGVLLFLVFILTVFFKQPRWVLLPLFCCLATGLLMLGLLGLLNWNVTVISSNFLSILLIITLSLTIHLIVRFRDLQISTPHKTHKELIVDSVNSMAQPCFYTILTTAVAFGSLIVSEIRPVIDFGWIMVIGLAIAFTVSFLVFPSILALMPKTDLTRQVNFTRNILLSISRIVKAGPKTVIFICVFLMISVGSGIASLKVENRFIDNFKPSTEIYQGMKVIDQQLGGTTPLDLIIDPDQDFYQLQQELLEEDNFENLFLDESEEVAEYNYWLNRNMMDKAELVHKHIESYSTIGKVISVNTALSIIEKLNNGPLSNFEMAVIQRSLPEEIKQDLIDPYLSDDANQIRFSIRAIETDPSLNRKQLLSEIKNYLVNVMEFEEDQVHLTGMLVLYNNMLQSLYRSQILTIGAVFIAIFITFVILFRSVKLAVLGIIPNIFSAILILGVMGWIGVPLDMMTITIAAITIGISVDDTIHYIHRFTREYSMDNNIEAAIGRSHGGIGKAIYHTSVAIIFGFALLALSNFVPTIHFGLLTGFAMLFALAGDLFFLPAIILAFRENVLST